MKTLKLYTSLFILGFVFLAVTGYRTYVPSDEHAVTNKSIIKFSHKTHKDAAECNVCHTEVEKSKDLKSQLLPKMEVCGTCHDIQDKNNCNQCHYGDNKRPFPAPKSPKILFSHEFHLANNKDCSFCHKGIFDVDYAEDAPHYLPSMATCYTCHDGKTKATDKCEACHVSTVDLKPADHKKTDYLRFHKFAAQSSKANCVMCHDNNSCEDCHVATGVTGANSPTDFIQPYAGTQFIDGSKQQKITRVHDLNFRFTHGIAASGKEMECASCHSSETFCSDCHNAERGDYNLGGVKPASHYKAGFVFTGSYGSGGGEHARLAKRDIEACASCHDAEGADPVCITCHIDNDGQQYTNPKTHKKGAMKDLGYGDWHTDRGSICYSCHIDANARPNGVSGTQFCGYCHGSKR